MGDIQRAEEVGLASAGMAMMGSKAQVFHPLAKVVNQASYRDAPPRSELLALLYLST